MTLRDAHILSELCVIAQKIYSDATHVPLFTLCNPQHVIAILTEFSLPFFYLLLVLTITVKSKLLVIIYSLLHRLINEVIKRFLEARIK